MGQKKWDGSVVGEKKVGWIVVLEYVIECASAVAMAYAPRTDKLQKARVTLYLAVHADWCELRTQEQR